MVGQQENLGFEQLFLRKDAFFVVLFDISRKKKGAAAVVQAQDQSPVVGVVRDFFPVPHRPIVAGQGQIGQAGDGKAIVPGDQLFPCPGNPYLTTTLFRCVKKGGKTRFLTAGFADPENFWLKSFDDPRQAVKVIGMGMGEDDLLYPSDLPVP